MSEKCPLMNGVCPAIESWKSENASLREKVSALEQRLKQAEGEVEFYKDCTAMKEKEKAELVSDAKFILGYLKVIEERVSPMIIKRLEKALAKLGGGGK